VGRDQPATVYRFTWIPSFHPSVLVHIQSDDHGYTLLARILTGAGGYEPGGISRDTAFSLSELDQAVLARLLTEAHFWSSPTIPPPNGLIGVDGSQWLLEGVEDGRYHVVDRWSPSTSGPDAAFRRVGEWLLTRSGLVPDSLLRHFY
jgi:hypothetical protein